MRSTRFSDVFFNSTFSLLLSGAALLASGSPVRAAGDQAVVGVLRPVTNAALYNTAAALQRGIIDSARAGSLFAVPPVNPGPLWYAYGQESDITPRNLERYEEICATLGCSHLLMGKLYAGKKEILAEIRLYSSREKRLLRVPGDTIAPGAVNKPAERIARRVSLYLLGRLPAVNELRVSKGSSPADVTLSWKCPGSDNNFIISRSPFETGPYAKIGETRSTRFIDTTAEQGMKYWYSVSVARGGLEGIPASGSGYRKPPAPQGLTVNGMMDGRTRPWPEPGSREERERERLHLQLFEKYYESPFMVAFIIMVGKMYINSGELIAFRDFTSYAWEPGERVVYLMKPGMPRIRFHSRRFFRFARDMHDLHIPFEELMPRVIGNAILFCVRVDDQETRLADGRTRYVPVLEGVGLSTEYHRDYVKWRSNTVVFGTSTDALYKRILEAQRRGY